MFTRSKLDWHTGQAILRRFTDLLRLVNAHEALRRGELSEFGTGAVIAFTRKRAGETFTVLVNLRKMPTLCRLPQANQGSIVLDPYEVRITPSN
jgi:glycosidase